MKLSELNPGEQFCIIGKNGIYEMKKHPYSAEEGKYLIQCLTCKNVHPIFNETEIYEAVYGSPEERVSYGQGYENHEKLMIDFIEKWNGETNSALGDLLYKKFTEFKNKIIKE